MWASFNRAIARLSNVASAVFFIFVNAVTRHNKTMYIQIIIKDEQLIANEKLKPKSDFESDLDSLLAPLATNHECFYCFYRLDSKNSLGYEFILYSFINDSAPVRSKMIYASTLSTVKVMF